MSINQLILQEKFGPLSYQDERLDDVVSHRRAVEDDAGVATSPSTPTGFVRTAIDAVQERLGELDEAMADVDDPEVRDEVAEFATTIRDEVEPVDAVLKSADFRQVRFLGAAIHWTVARDIRWVHDLRETYAGRLCERQDRALEDVLDALRRYEVTREYFRVQHLQLQFVRFTHGMLLTGLPALLVAHYATGLIGPGAPRGATLGVSNLLWLESGLFAFAMLPAFVIVSFVARIVTLTLTSVFPGPFSIDEPR